MRKLINVIAAGLMLVSVSAMAELKFELKNLPADRTGMEYAASINALDSKISGFKWQAPNNLGYVFTLKINNQRTQSNDYLFANIGKFMYTQNLRESEYYVRQSERVGYVEFVGVDNPSSQFHVKLIDDNTLEVFEKANEKNESKRMIFKKVKQFKEKPSNMPKLESAEESGLIY